MARKRTVVALFAKPEAAARAVRSLLQVGLTPEQVGLLEPQDEQNPRTGARGAVIGLMLGVLVGAVIGGLLAAVLVWLVPGASLTLAGTDYGALAVGVIGGAATGSLTGMLFGAELDEDEELYFMEEVQSGRTLVAVETADRERDAVSLLRNSGAFEVDRLGGASLRAGLRHPGPLSRAPTGAKRPRG